MLYNDYFYNITTAITNFCFDDTTNNYISTHCLLPQQLLLPLLSLPKP